MCGLCFVSTAILLIHWGLLGITAGAHRLWSHKAYKAKWPLKLILTIFNTIAHQNGIWVWVHDHRYVSNVKILAFEMSGSGRGCGLVLVALRNGHDNKRYSARAEHYRNENEHTSCRLRRRNMFLYTGMIMPSIFHLHASCYFYYHMGCPHQNNNNNKLGATIAHFLLLFKLTANQFTVFSSILRPYR